MKDQRIKYILGTVLGLLLIYFTYLMTLITLQYVPINYEVAFLALKEEQIALDYYKVSFFTHVYTSLFTLIIGGFQFVKYIRINKPKVHRLLGKSYTFLILFLAAPSGLVMAIHANGGTIAKVSFVFQALLWFLFTLNGWRTAIRKKWYQHHAWMILSYAMTLSAVSLRLIKWILVNTLAPPPMDTYRFVSWAGWVVNLIIAGIIIQRLRTRHR